MAWRMEQDIEPLIALLGTGDADADAQKLAGELLSQARQNRLGHKRRFHMRTEAMLAHWAVFRTMGSPSEDAKQAVADMYGITVDAVEKAMVRNPKLVAQLKAEMKLD